MALGSLSLATLAKLATLVALVVKDQAPLRASAHDNAPRQTNLTAGDWLEVRGERQGYLEVYDHRRERPGYVRPAAVRSYAVDEATAPKLGTLVEYLRDAPGQESLGIGYVALYLRAAPPSAAGAEVFDALGTMAERLGRRASARAVTTGTSAAGRAGDGSLAAQLEVAESYGVHFVSFEREGETHICYDGEAFRHVLALGGTGPERARAALGLTEPSCVDPALGPTAALASAKWRADVLDTVDAKPGPDGHLSLPAFEQARLRLRRSIVASELSYFAARTGDLPLAKQAGEEAKRELQLADRATLADDDRLVYDEAALRAATVRWATEPLPAPASSLGLEIEVAAGAPGQTCVRVKKRAAPNAAPFEHCTYGVVWPSSIRVAPHESAVAMVVQPLPGWSELLLLHPSAGGASADWVADTMTPAAIDPELGYVELAGFSPDGAHLLVVRESRASGPLGSPHTLAPWMQRTFQMLGTSSLQVEKQASTLASFPTFRRWQTAEWQRGTLALR
jgi:hypothetical protein